MLIPQEFLVTPTHTGVRLDHFLGELGLDYSRSRLQMFVREGHITVDGETVRPNHKLRGKEKVILTEPPPTASTTEAQDIALDVLFEDEDIIVINKPPGLVVHPAAGHQNGTLVNALLFHCDELSGIGGVERPGIVHRLDKETSGCLVAAKNDLAHQSLTTQFAERDITKIYLAIVAGPMKRREGVVDVPIGRHRVHRQKMSVARPGEGKEAKTGWRVLGELAGGTLVECTLFTGRTHQIRVHMKHLCTPLVGDEITANAVPFSGKCSTRGSSGFSIREPASGSTSSRPSPKTSALPESASYFPKMECHY